MPKKKKEKKKRGLRSYGEIGREIQAQKPKRKKLNPGPFSDIETELTVTAKLRTQTDSNFGLPPHLGKYYTHDYGNSSDDIRFWDPIGGYKAVCNVKIDNVEEVLDKHSVNEIVAAIEVSLNSYKNKRGKKLLGDIVVAKLLNDPWRRLDEGREVFFGLEINTNRRNILNFAGMKTVQVEVFGKKINRKKLVVF